MSKIKRNKKDVDPLKKSNNQSALNSTNKILVFLSIILFTVSILMVWLRPTSNGDLSFGIAQGKDVVNGKIGKADDWSYMTRNKICMNQNWGADLVLFLTNTSCGGRGLVVLKLLLVALVSVLVYFILLRINIPWYYISVFPAMIMYLSSELIQLRPDIFGILLLLLFVLLLVRIHKNHFVKYLSAFVLLVWANTHGSYIFGFGLFFLFIVLTIAFAKRARFLENKEILHLAIIFLVSIALSMIITPYGLNGITIPFRFLNSDYSLYKKYLYEWQPVWVHSSYGNIKDFFIGVGLFVTVGCIRLAIGFKNTGIKNGRGLIKQSAKFDASSLFFEVFFTLTALIAIAMAVSSRRFITYAVIFSAISCAIYLKHIIQSVKLSRTVIIALDIILIAVGGKLLLVNIEQYSENNPVENCGTFYDKMFFINPDNPVKLAQFISTNKIYGNIFCYWTWEGYLRNYCPDLKVFAGGRAHQIYDNSIYILYRKLLDRNPPISSLEKLSTSLIAIPSRSICANLIKELYVNPNWEVLYADDRDILFVVKKINSDSGWKTHLQYPDNESKTLSSYASALGKCVEMSSEFCAQADSVVRNYYVCPWYYFFKTKRFVIANKNEQFLENDILSDLNRFVAIAKDNKKGLSILESSEDLLQTLIDYYKYSNTPQKVNNLRQYLEIEKRIPIKR